jgi:hypothetical protein
MTTLTDIVDRLRRAYTRTGGNSVGDPYTSAIAAELAGLHARIDGQLVAAQGFVLEAERHAQDAVDRNEGETVSKGELAYEMMRFEGGTWTQAADAILSRFHITRKD